MIPLDTLLDRRLWEAVAEPFQAGNYRTAIVDAIQFLDDLIREKTALESDGVNLIGQAFGGVNPKLKVNKLQAESDQNVQKGILQILTGMYQAIRNPRSHEKYSDSRDDADAIVLFIGYLVRIIDQSKSPFEKNAYLDRVFDPDFPDHERYAELLVQEIPPGKRWDILVEVYRRKEEGKGNKL